MAWAWKDYLIAGLAVAGGLKVVETIKGVLTPRINEDDVDFRENRDGTWTILDAETGTELGTLSEDEDGFSVDLDYAPGDRTLHLVLEREFGVEKNLDSAKDVVVEYLREHGLLEED